MKEQRKNVNDYYVLSNYARHNKSTFLDYASFYALDKT